ncbi:hypothetical protein [Methylomagnum ishizawai]|uniref:hypothetical protein n=1 Tax=Methylomagnum ishizawai TaxID=1760988 RepID=UPI001C808968|nr:hypothetical protein [Methylomagnum ishizawai]
MPTMKHVRLRQLLAQGRARTLVDEQYFAQRRAERAHRAAYAAIECEANAPRGPVQPEMAQPNHTPRWKP